MLKKFNAIVILFFILKNYSEGAPKKRKGETSGQQTQGNANYFEGGSSSSPALTLVSPTNFSCQWDGCEQVFDNEETFVEHVKAHANMEKDKKCHWRDCEREKPFQRPAHLKQHIVGHTGEKLYVCEYVNQNGVRCDKSYTREHNLKNHQQTHAGERNIFKCAYPPCTQSYLNQSDKVEHERSHTDPNFYQCPLDNCRESHNCLNALKNHVCKEHKQYGTNFWESIVEYKKDNKLKSYGLFGITEDGILYKRNDNGAGSSNANNQVEDNKCHWRDCEREEPFQHPAHLKRHIVGHTGEKLYHVNENGVRCDKSYTQSHNLKNHQQTHAGERIIYKCAYPPCTKTFETFASKFKHEKIHINPNHYGCPVFMCPKQKYKDPTSLRKHVCTKHGENVWDFIIANKKAKKANGYGKIGIREDGTLFEMLDQGAGSSNANNQVDVGQTTQGVQEHFVHPTYQHGGELQLFPTNVEHQEDNQNEDYLMQENNPNEDLNTTLSLWH
uniref:C2H2-type domain-containing protein n=1 Tax=Meloidogyne enterolobii TaxID=390850 RepID=A0A6V7X774_MELEN|nr:unnamed protein product [Meloidogyne enterolobii]